MDVMSITVPSGENDFIMRVLLDGKMRYLHMSYNSTGDYWTIAYCDSEGTPIVSGIKIVPNFPLNFFYSAHDIPQGMLYVQSSQDKVGKNAFADGSATLRYIPAESLGIRDE